MQTHLFTAAKQRKNYCDIIHTRWFIVYFMCKCLSLLCLCFQKYAVSKMRRPLLAALWCVDRKRDSTAVFTNMFSWVNTQDRGTRPCCKQSSSQCHQRADEEKYFGFIISRVHYSQDVRGVCLRCVAVCLGQFEDEKKPKRRATARFVSCQFHKLSLTDVLASKKPCFGPFLW